jgi:WD40 repeat protein
VLRAKYRPCKSWIQSGSCPNSNCQYAHIVQLHARVEASSHVQQDYQQQQNSNYHHHPTRATIADVAIWETQGQIKIFTGSSDGFWRLWNTSANFAKEFETKVGLKVTCLNVTNSFLFCGMEAIGHAVPDTSVGMLHAWNLSQPTHPPLELQLGKFLPYAHNQCVTALAVQDSHVVTGSRDGSIRLWTFTSSNNTFVLDKSLAGHAREVTGLVVIKESQLLWSSSIDGSMRIWDLSTGDCHYSIPKQSSTPTLPPPPPSAPPTPTHGHANAVTALESFHSPAAGTFVLSASLDGTIKAWNGTTGECVASEAHGEGVVSLAIASADASLSSATKLPQVLLVGLESGNIVARNLVQTSKVAAFEALFVLTSKFNVGHYGAVKCITPGPQATFYTGGTDGNLMVWQINGDLGLN